MNFLSKRPSVIHNFKIKQRKLKLDKNAKIKFGFKQEQTLLMPTLQKKSLKKTLTQKSCWGKRILNLYSLIHKILPVIFHEISIIYTNPKLYL